MKQTIILIFLFCGFATLGQTSFSYQRDFKQILFKTKDSNDNLFYNKLLKRFECKDTTLTDFEVLALLIGFTDKPEYNPYNDLLVEREIQLMNNDRKYTEALDKSNTYLKTHPVSRKVLYEKSYALSKLGKYDSSSFYSYQSNRIIKAMSFSGDGKTIYTPILILNTDDPQDYITLAVGAYMVTMRLEMDKEGNYIYVQKIVYRQQEERPIDLHFVITHAANKKFGENSIEEYLLMLERESKNRLKWIKN